MTNPNENEKRQALEAVRYEIDQLLWTVVNSPTDTLGGQANAILESRLIHMRNLDEFFSFQPFDDYVRCSHYGFQRREAIADKSLRGRLSEDVAHLTFARVSRAKMKWSNQLALDILRCCLLFAEHVLVSNISDNTAQWKELAGNLRNATNSTPSFAILTATTTSVQISVSSPEKNW